MKKEKITLKDRVLRQLRDFGSITSFKYARYTLEVGA